MIRIKTRNSIYEIDTDSKLARRIDGRVDPTDRFSPGGEWKPYVNVEGAKGTPLIFTWPDGQPELRDHTVTSTVVEWESPCPSEVQET